MKRALKFLAAAIVLLVLSFVAYVWSLSNDAPAKKAGDADALAHKIAGWVDMKAWDKTRAIRWNNSGSRFHLWDRDRGFARVKWKDAQVWLRTGDKTGIAFENGQQVTGPREAELLKKAYAWWINDAFWLNPFATFFGPGVSRELVDLADGTHGLRVTYSSGGVTPGDSYVWSVSPEGEPKYWRMWVNILPVAGLESSWDGWKKLSTGAKISTSHKIGFLTLDVNELKGGTTLASVVPGEDPFAKLISDKAPSSRPASQATKSSTTTKRTGVTKTSSPAAATQPAK